MYNLIFFHQICEVFCHVLFKYFSALFPSSSPLGLSLCVCWSLSLSHTGLWAHWLLFILFAFVCLFPRLNYLFWPIFMFPDSSTHLNLLLSPSSEIFISVLVLFSFRISIWFHFIILFVEGLWWGHVGQYSGRTVYTFALGFISC